MGADMLLSSMVAPHFAEHMNMDSITKVAIQAGVNRIEALSFEDVPDDVVQYMAEVAETESAISFDPSREVLIEEIKQKAIEAIRNIVQDFGPRDITVMTMNDQDYWMTGGMSWGDAPTDSFTLVMLLDTLDTYDDPITADEVLAAQESLAKQDTET